MTVRVGGWPVAAGLMVAVVLGAGLGMLVTAEPEPGPPPTPPPSAVPSTAPSRAVVQAPQGVLDRTGTAPPGVAEQLQFFEGGDPVCGDDDRPGPPRVSYLEAKVPVTYDLRLCFARFDASEPLQVTVTPPGRQAESWTMLEDSGSTVIGEYFRVRPGDPYGRYRVTARQGKRTVKAAFDVVPATGPLLVLDVPTGWINHLYLGGFPKNRPATIHLYGSSGGGMPVPYRTSFTVPVDARGEADVVLDGHRSRTHACFFVVAEGRAPHEGTDPNFCLPPPRT